MGCCPTSVNLGACEDPVDLFARPKGHFPITLCCGLNLRIADNPERAQEWYLLKTRRSTLLTWAFFAMLNRVSVSNFLVARHPGATGDSLLVRRIWEDRSYIAVCHS
jgi:hypothetical protein